MLVNEIKENDDGSATLQVTFAPKEVGYLLEKALVDMLRDYIEKTPSYAHNET
jgi:hypothetical protein